VCTAADATDGLRSSTSAARGVWAGQLPLHSRHGVVCGARRALLQN